jgi:hypothetical protein
MTKPLTNNEGFSVKPFTLDNSSPKPEALLTSHFYTGRVNEAYETEFEYRNELLRGSPRLAAQGEIDFWLNIYEQGGTCVMYAFDDLLNAKTAILDARERDRRSGS